MTETEKADKGNAAGKTETAGGSGAAADKAAGKFSLKGRKYPKGLTLFAAGLAGGIIALLGGAALLSSGSMRSANPPVRAETAASIAAERKAIAAQFQAQLEEREKAWSAQSAQMRGQIDELRQKTDAAADNAPAGAPDAGLSDKVAALAQKLDAQADAVRANAGAIAALKDSVLDAEQRRAALEPQVQALREDMRRLAEKRDNARKNVTRLLALQEFQKAIDRGAPYAAQLAVFNAAFPGIWENIQNSGDSDIAALLARWQQTGLPQDSALAQDFTRLADRLAGRSGDAAQDSGLWRKTRNFISPWISARPQGQVAGNSPAAVLARAEFALEHGDDAAALRETENLPPDMRGRAAEFFAPLYLRQAAHHAIAQALRQLFPREDNAVSAAPAVPPAPVSSAPAGEPADKADAAKPADADVPPADKAAAESVPPAPAAPAPSSAPVPAPASPR